MDSADEEEWSEEDEDFPTPPPPPPPPESGYGFFPATLSSDGSGAAKPYAPRDQPLPIPPMPPPTFAAAPPSPVSEAAPPLASGGSAPVARRPPAARPAAARGVFAAAALEPDAVPNGRVVDETTVQQLRGVFAIEDADRDGLLTRPQLVKAVAMLGLRATDARIEAFLAHGSKKQVDLKTFLAVASAELERDASAPDGPGSGSVEAELLELFAMFDQEHTGTVTLRTLRHLLLDVLTPERLSRAEFDEFVHYAGLAVEPSDAMAYGPDADEQVRVDYRKYINNMLIGRPPMKMRLS